MDEELSLIGEKDKNVTEEQKELFYNRVEELRYSNAALLAETDMFARFIGRLDPKDLESGAEGSRVAGDSQLDGGDVGWMQKPRSNIPDGPQPLALEQKLYVAQREVAETWQDQEKLKQKYERIQENYKASMNEAELRLTEIRKAKNKFERRFLKSMEDRLEVNQPEKVTRLERFNLKNQTLKVQEKRLLQQLQQKKEMGKADYEVFFQDHNEPIIDRNLGELQVNSFKVQRVLSTHKEQLQSVTLESTELSNDIAKKIQMLAKIEEEIQHAEKERLKAEALNQHLHRQLTDYQVPDIIEYVHAKDKKKKLQQSIHTWERKVGIAEMTLKTHTREWSKYRATQTPANSAGPGTRSGEHKVPVKFPHIAEHNS
ncbi:cilia- and flagella-associated protein 263 isoform 2-T2 [Odontesthes bonariensis]